MVLVAPPADLEVVADRVGEVHRLAQRAVIRMRDRPFELHLQLLKPPHEFGKARLWHRESVACPADAYRVGDVKLFKDGDFFLVRRAEGFLAMTRWCTHLNGRIIYQREHWRFYCPYHQSTFDRCGDPIGGEPNLTALRLNRVSFSADGRVLVDTDDVIERGLFDPTQAVLPPAAAVAAR